MEQSNIQTDSNQSNQQHLQAILATFLHWGAAVVADEVNIH